MELLGSGGGSLDISDTLTLSGEIKFNAPDYSLDNGTLALNGGTLTSAENSSVSSDVIHLQNSTLDVAADKVLSYSGSDLEIGALTLTMSGGGSFKNSAELLLNNASSVLKLNGIVKVEKITVAENLSEGFIDVQKNATIQTLSHAKSTKIDIAETMSLTLTDSIEVTATQTMELMGSGGGTLNIGENFTLSGTLKLNAPNNTLNNGTLIFNNGLLDLDENATVSAQISLADNASMDLAVGKQLSLSKTFEIPENLKLEMVADGGGTLSLAETLKLEGILQFAAPDYSFINGAIELGEGGLLDIDANTTIASNISLSGSPSSDHSFDIADGSTLYYEGNAIDISTYQLTILGKGELNNINSILLSNSMSKLVLADDITIKLIEVTGNSLSGYGIVVQSNNAKVITLNLSADMGLSFSDDTYVLNVENLNVKATAQLNGDGNGLLLVKKIEQIFITTGLEEYFVLKIHDVNLKVLDEIDVIFADQIVMSGNSSFESEGGLAFMLDGTMNFNGTVTANINLDGGTMCVYNDTTLIGNIRHVSDSIIYIAPEKILTYQGDKPLNVRNLTLALQGGGRFANTDNNSILLNEDGGRLKLAGNATTLSHLGIAQSDYNGVKFLDVDNNANSTCVGDNNTSQGFSKIVVEHLDQKGNSNIGLSAMTELSFTSQSSVASQKSMTVSGESGKLSLDGTMSFENGSQFVLNSPGTIVSGAFNFVESNILNAKKSASFQSSIGKWKNAQIIVDSASVLTFEDNQFETQGTFIKTGGDMYWDNVSWSLLDDTDYSSDNLVETKTLSLNNYQLTLGLPESDLIVTDNMTFDNSSEKILTGAADLSIYGGVVIEDGLISSTSGLVYFGKGGTQTGGDLDVSNSTFKLSDDFTKTAGTLTMTEVGTTLELTESLALRSDTSLGVKTLKLNDETLTLVSDTTDLTVIDAITMNDVDEQIRTNSADLTLNGLLTVANGGIDSDNGTLTFSTGIKQSGGLLNINSSLLELGADVYKTGGTLNTPATSVTVLNSLIITSDSTISVSTINLGANTLSLGSASSDLYISGNLSLADANVSLNIEDADLTVQGEVELANGKLSSTGGAIIFRKGVLQSGTFEFDLSSSTLSLNGDYTKSGGLLDSSSATLYLLDNITVSSDSALEFNQLELNDLTLTLGSPSTDLTIITSITLDNVNEWLVTADGDLSLLDDLNISDGGITSTGGIITMLGGGQLSGTGELDFSGSTWVLGGDFVKTSGTLWETDLKLAANITFTSNATFSFLNLDLNDSTLTLGSSSSDLSVVNAVVIDAETEGILTADADLILLSKLTMSDGQLTSTGGNLKLAHAQTSKFSGNALLMLDNTLLTSDDGNGVALIKIDGEPNLSMTDNSQISYINLSTSDGTVGSISTSGEVSCLENCTGFTETGAYGFNSYGLYRNISSSNLVLTESEGEQKTATLSVKLLSRPDSIVQVAFRSSDETEATVDKKVLTFTPTTWNRIQQLTITGEDDSVVDNDMRVGILGYTDSDDTNYASTSTSKTHAFKYSFMVLNDDLQKGRSPIVKIGPDQSLNEETRVILDGSASYDPDQNGRIVEYLWVYAGQRNDIVIERKNESIAYFVAPDIDEEIVLLFGLEVIDDDSSSAYGATTITLIPVKTVPGVDGVIGGITPKYPEDIILDAEITNTDGSKTLKLVSADNTILEIDMNMDGTVNGKIITEDGSESKVLVPLGAEVNMNKDGSLSVTMSLEGATLSTNVSSEGEMTIGISSETGSTGAFLKAPKGSEVSIGTDGTSSIYMPASTDPTSGVTSQVLSSLSLDGSTLTEMTFSGGTGRTTNADGSESNKSSLVTESGLNVAIDTSSGIAASLSLPNSVGTLAASILNDGTSSTSFDNGSSGITTFNSTTAMDLLFKKDEELTGKIVSTSTAETGSDGISRTTSSSTTSEGAVILVQGTGVSDSTLQVATGSTVSLSKNRTVTSTLEISSSSMSSIVTMNSEGLMIPTITTTTLSPNTKQIFPEVGAGSTVSQEYGKMVISIPLTNSGSTRSLSRSSTSLRTSQRSGVFAEFSTNGQWVGFDTTSDKPVYVQSASSGATVVLENSYGNTTNVSLSSGTAELRIGDALPSALTGTMSISSAPASVTMKGARNLVTLPAFTTISPSNFESQFPASEGYKAVMVRRSDAWQFYSTSDDKTVYTDKGYTELTSSIEAGEGIWVMLNSPVKDTNLEVANYGGYSASTQLSSMTSEWNLAGTSKEITVEEITQAANFDQTSEDESNTLGFLDNSRGNGPTSGLQISNLNYEIAGNEFGQSSRIILLMALLLLASASVMLYRRQTQLRNSSQFQNILLRTPTWQMFTIVGIIMFVVACAPPQSDSTSSTFDYSGSYDRVHSIWKWDDINSKWEAYSPKTSIAAELVTQGYSTFSSVEKGKGYWLRMSSSGVPTSLSFAEPPAF